MIEALNCEDAVFRLNQVVKNSRVEETAFGNSMNRITKAYTVNSVSVKIRSHKDRDKLITDPKRYQFLTQEFDERVSPMVVNPGEAYKNEKQIWEKYLKDGKFSYTYSERLVKQLTSVKAQFKSDLYTRQAYLSIWDADKDVPNLEMERVPCTLGYHLKRFNNKNILLTIMRSWEMDFCVPNDIWLSSKLAEWLFDGQDSELEFFASTLQRFIKED